MRVWMRTTPLSLLMNYNTYIALHSMKKKPKKITLKEILPKYTLDDVIETEESKERTKVAEEEIDQHLDLLQKHIGRELVASERRNVFDIVDEFSTKDEEGYIVLYFSFIQAWKIYEQRRKQLNKPKK
jgi:transcription initiation factor IIE alpha subunit